MSSPNKHCIAGRQVTITRQGPKPKHHHKQQYFNCAAGTTGPQQQ